jgi:hypothetical protein
MVHCLKCWMNAKESADAAYSSLKSKALEIKDGVLVEQIQGTAKCHRFAQFPT